MKINIEIDCSPAEARAFLGLPDVGPMQATMTEELQKRLQAALKASDPETLLKAWLPGGVPIGMKGWEDFQRQFWSQMSSQMSPHVSSEASGKTGSGKSKKSDEG
jgi:hypothetical protein